jgi:hypothetical protein
VQQEEMEKMRSLFKYKKGGEEVIWSFNYENKHNNTVKDAYERALEAMIAYGAYDGYSELVYILNEVAKSSSGINEGERLLISRFEDDLLRGLSTRPTEE